MSNKNLVKNIANNSIQSAIFAALADFDCAHDTIVAHNRKAAKAMTAWKNTHNYDNAAALARGKNAKDADKAEFERLKAARADYADIIKKNTAEKCKPARDAMNAVYVRIFGRGGKNDKSTRAMAFNQFYTAYAAYRKELSMNASTPAGNKARKALNNLWNKCFGFTFHGSVASDVSRRALNAIGMRIANSKENMQGANGIAPFSEKQVKTMLIYIAMNMLNSGTITADIAKEADADAGAATTTDAAATDAAATDAATNKDAGAATDNK